MSNLTRVYPAEGRALRIPPHFELLPNEGALVDVSKAYWKRALKDGDVSTKRAVGVAKFEEPTKLINKGEKS